ncbi:hypothetical protein ACS0TY_027224 [Phlomoides rotata]
MNVLARKLSTHLSFSPPSLGRRLIYLHPITVIQQCNFYATRAPRTKWKDLTISSPEIQKSSESSPSLIKKQTEAQTTVWPKPIEIPFQAKVANFVNLIGYVKIPVQFESDSDGKHFAATVISLRGGSWRKPLLIPVVFEGDLAHIVACHVKENDSVFVSGKFSVEPLRLVLSENLGKFHIVADNLNFVEGFQKDKIVGVKVENSEQNYIQFPAKELEILEHRNVEELSDGNKGGVSFSSKKKNAEEVLGLWRDLVKNPQQWWDYRQHKANGLVKEKFPDFKQKESGEPLWISSAPKWVFPGLGKLECDVKDLSKSNQVQIGEFKNGGLEDNWKKQVQIGEVKNGGLEDSWKKQVQIGEFKNGGLEDNWKKQVQIGEFKNGGLEDSWKNLVENPSKWWDNRVNKRNPRAPDFKHKETGEGLWLDRSPGWVLSKLPPMKGDQTAAYVDSFGGF